MQVQALDTTLALDTTVHSAVPVLDTPVYSAGYCTGLGHYCTQCRVQALDSTVHSAVQVLDTTVHSAGYCSTGRLKLSKAALDTTVLYTLLYSTHCRLWTLRVHRTRCALCPPNLSRCTVTADARSAKCGVRPLHKNLKNSKVYIFIHLNYHADI